MSTLKPIMPEHILNIDTSFVSNHRKKISEIYESSSKIRSRIINLFEEYDDKELSFERKPFGWHARFSDQVDFWEIKTRKEEDMSEQIGDLTSKQRSGITNELVNEKMAFIKNMINIQLVDDGYVNYLKDSSVTDKSDQLDKDVSKACSFQANVVRNGVFAWVLGRLGEDMEYEFEALGEYRDIVDSAFDIACKGSDFVKYLIEDVYEKEKKEDKLVMVQLDDGTTTIMEDAEASGMNNLGDVNLTWDEYYYLMDRKAYLEYCSDPINATKNPNQITFENFEEALQEKDTDLIQRLKKCNGIKVLSDSERNKAKKEWIFTTGAYNLAEKASLYDPSNSRYNKTYNLTYPTRIFAIGANGEETNISNDDVSAVKKIRIYFRVSTGFRPICIDVLVPSNASEETKIRYLATSLLPICDKIMENVNSYSKTRGWFKTILDGINHGAELGQAIFNYNTEKLEFGFHDLHRKFKHAADCIDTVPSILEHSLSYIRSGHYFDAATNVRSIGPTHITLTKEEINANSVKLSWDSLPNATEYYVFKNGVYSKTASTDTTTINELEPGTPHSFYINAVDASGTVLAQSQTIMVTTEPAPAPEQE